MVGSVFNTFKGGAFKGLIGIGQFFNTFLVRLRHMGQTLRATGLPGAARGDFRGIVAKFIDLHLFIGTELRVALKRCVAGFSVIGHAAFLV